MTYQQSALPGEPVSLVPQDAYALVGHEIDRASGVVYRKEFQRWAAAACDLNPLYFDRDYARALGHPDVVMPPMFIANVIDDVNFLDSLRPDGARNGNGLNGIRLRTSAQMAGGDDMMFYRPAYPGDTIEAVFTLASIAEKLGRSGPFVLTRREVTYTNQHGELVARRLTSIISR